MSELKPYDRRSKCPKCGHGAIDARYCDNGRYRRIDIRRCPRGEHIHRTCTNCYYSWLEATLEECLVILERGEPR